MLRSHLNRRFNATSIGVCLMLACGVRPATDGKNDPVPHEQIPGKWKDAKGTTVTIDTDEKGDFRLTRDGVLWEQLIPYRPGPFSSLSFKHTPTIDELAEDMPKEIKEAAVEAALEWHIRFTTIETGYRVLGNQCRLYMKGEFLPGIVKWDTVTDQNTGQKNVFISAKIGGPAKQIELKQILYELPAM